MPVASSGAISLNDFHVEAGGSTGSSCTINDADIRGLIDKSDGATMAFNEWYGATAALEQDSGSVTNFGSSNAEKISSTFDSNSNKVVIVYRDKANGNKGTAVVGTPAADLSISFGTPVVFYNASLEYAGPMDATFDSNSNKVVIAYALGSAGSYYGQAIVGTVSGTSISFGSATTFASSNTEQICATFDTNSNKVVICWYNASSSAAGTAIVGTVSGTSISFGSAATWGFKSSNISVTFDNNSNKVVVIAEDGSPGVDTAKAVVGTVSSTSISFGTPVQVGSTAENLSGSGQGATFDSNSNKVIYFFRDVSDSNKGKAIVGTVSGTSISFGSLATFDSGAVNDLSRKGAFDTNVNKVVYSYESSASSNTRVVVGTVSGTSISFNTPAEIHSSPPDEPISVASFDSNLNKVIISFQKNDSVGAAVVFQNAD